MRSKAKFVFLIFGILILIGWFLFTNGILSTPRDVSSPQTIIRLVDENGSPLSGIEVGRNWYDSDCGMDGSDTRETNQDGIARFPKVSARVGLFTGALRKAVTSFAMCGYGSGTSTSIYVRYRGLCTVVPKDKPLHPVGQSNQDPDGVWFDSTPDDAGNTMVHIAFLNKTKNIDYVLLSYKLRNGK